MESERKVKKSLIDQKIEADIGVLATMSNWPLSANDVTFRGLVT